MKFEEALIELRKGKKIRHSFFKENGYADLNNIHQIQFSGAMLMCEQWSIYEEPGKTFPEVFESLNEGKKVKRKYWDFYITKESVHSEDLLATDWIVLEE